MSNLPPFFIFNFVGVTSLSSGERILMIQKDFPNANLDKIGFITVGSINVLLGAPRQELATLSVERTLKAIRYNYSDGKINYNLLLPEKVSSPVEVHNRDEIWQKCYHSIPSNCELEHSKCQVNWSLSELNINVKEYQFVYNCIGWALGIEVWLEPVQREDGLLDITNFSELKEVTEKFLNDTLNTYKKSENLHFLKYDIIENIEKIVCNNVLSEEVTKEGAVAFYFNNFGMTHAARFVENFDGYQINAWTSKLGHNIMISHDLQDLSGYNSLYGYNLCYALPRAFPYIGNISTMTSDEL